MQNPPTATALDAAHPLSMNSRHATCASKLAPQACEDTVVHAPGTVAVWSMDLFWFSTSESPTNINV